MLLPKFTFSRTCTCQKLHFEKAHLAEFTFGRNCIFPETYFPEFTFGRNYISPKTYFSEFTLARIYIWPKLHFPETLFSRNYIWPKLHFPENIFPEYTFSRNYISPKTYIFQKLCTSARNFIIDRIYITQIYRGECSGLGPFLGWAPPSAALLVDI